MNRGYFRASKELLDSDEKIMQAINQHFTEVHRKEVENGIIEIHGYSNLFTIIPHEWASQQYEIWMETTENGIKVEEIRPVM